MLGQTDRRRQSTGGPADSARVPLRGASRAVSAAPPSRSDQDGAAPDSGGAGRGLCPSGRGRGARIFRGIVANRSQELQRLEDQLSCSVVPRPLELQRDATVAPPLQALLHEGRTQDVSAQTLLLLLEDLHDHAVAGVVWLQQGVAGDAAVDLAESPDVLAGSLTSVRSSNPMTRVSARFTNRPLSTTPGRSLMRVSNSAGR